MSDCYQICALGVLFLSFSDFNAFINIYEIYYVILENTGVTLSLVYEAQDNRKGGFKNLPRPCNPPKPEGSNAT